MTAGLKSLDAATKAQQKKALIPVLEKAFAVEKEAYGAVKNAQKAFDEANAAFAKEPVTQKEKEEAKVNPTVDPLLVAAMKRAEETGGSVEAAKNDYFEQKAIEETKTVAKELKTLKVKLNSLLEPNAQIVSKKSPAEFANDLKEVKEDVDETQATYDVAFGKVKSFSAAKVAALAKVPLPSLENYTPQLSDKEVLAAETAYNATVAAFKKATLELNEATNANDKLTLAL